LRRRAVVAVGRQDLILRSRRNLLVTMIFTTGC
jgi:hypothetical protein